MAQQNSGGPSVLKQKPIAVRTGNIVAARGTSAKSHARQGQLTDCYVAVADAIRTSLGPRGMDKMVCGMILHNLMCY